jgi:hypothetical protein
MSNIGPYVARAEKKTESLPVELATVQYASHTQITEIAFRVYGGSDHTERVNAVMDSLDNWTEHFRESEGTVVSIDSYECKAETTPSGTPYVLFTFGNFQAPTN